MSAKAFSERTQPCMNHPPSLHCVMLAHQFPNSWLCFPLRNRENTASTGLATPQHSDSRGPDYNGLFQCSQTVLKPGHSGECAVRKQSWGFRELWAGRGPGYESPLHPDENTHWQVLADDSQWARLIYENHGQGQNPS